MSHVTLVLTRKPHQEFVWLTQGRPGYEPIDSEAEKKQLYGDYQERKQKLRGGR